MQVEFVRSAKGLANYYLFLNVEYVFFCESEIKEVNEDPDIHSLDWVFWNLILRSKLNQDQFRLIECGSKTQVLQRVRLAVGEVIETGGGGRVFGCVDKDYDDFESDSAFSDIRQNIMATSGYSVENDLLELVGVGRVVEMFFPRLSESRRESVKEVLSITSRFLARVCYTDRLARSRGCEFLPTDGIPAFVQRQTTKDVQARPRYYAGYRDFKSAKLKKFGCATVSQLRQKPKLRHVGNRCVRDGFIDTPGKMVLKVVCHLLNAFGERIAKYRGCDLVRMADSLLAEFRRFSLSNEKLMHQLFEERGGSGCIAKC